MDYSNKTISWQAPEFRHYQKNHGWYVTIIAVTVLIVGFFIIIQGDIFAAVTMAVVGVVAVFFAKQEPRQVQITLGEKGIDFGNIHYPYKQFKYFWVVSNENHRTVNFHTNILFNGTVILELENQNPEQIRDFLLRRLPEHTEERETPIQRITHYLKF